MLFERLIKIFTSLRLTVVLLRCPWCWSLPAHSARCIWDFTRRRLNFSAASSFTGIRKIRRWKIPVFPGGYLIGMLLLLNLIAAHTSRFKFSREKIGLWIIHAGLILLLLGQLSTDMFAVESQMHLRSRPNEKLFRIRSRERTGSHRHHGQKYRKGRGDSRTVAGRKRRYSTTSQLPFIMRVKEFYANSLLSTNAMTGFEHTGATAIPARACGGSGSRAKRPPTAATRRRHSWKS